MKEQFDLELAVKKWCKGFRKHPAFNHGNIREMEVHILDHIDDLISEGYSEKVAFEKAVSDFGEIPQMAKVELSAQHTRNPYGLPIHLGLVKTNVKLSIRNFTKQPFFTSLNTIGLAVGFAGVILISLFIINELSYDSMFADSDRIYRVNIENMTSGEYSEYASAPGPMAGVLQQDCPNIEMVTRLRNVSGILLKVEGQEENVKENKITAADSSFLKMFGFELLEGDAKTALNQPFSLVLTKTAVRKHFPTGDALGKTMILNNKDAYMVTGVIDDFPKNSFLRDYSVLLSLTSFEDSKSLAWNTWSFPTFVKLGENNEVAELDQFLGTVKENYLIPWAMTFIPGLTVESSRAADAETGNFMYFTTTAVQDIHLKGGNRNGDLNTNSDIQNVYILISIAAFLLLMVCVNYMNLSTANSLRRAKEVGIRKTMGSGSLGLVKQFLTESILISLISVILSIAIAALVLPFFNVMAGTSLSIPFSSIVFWGILLLGSIALGVLAGLYPAFFMSGFSVLKALKDGATKRGSAHFVRNGLVVFQFVISVILIIGTLVVFEQVDYMKSKNLGFDKEQILVINDLQATGNQSLAFKSEVESIGQVINTSISSYLPTPSKRGGTTFFAESAFVGDDFVQEKALIIENWDIDPDYLATLNLELIAGRNFDRTTASDKKALIVNETMVEMLEMTADEAIGLRLTNDFHRPDKENMDYYTIIGVVKNFHFESLRNKINGLTMSLGNGDKLMVKLKSNQYSEVIGQIEDKWNEIAIGQPFSYYFMDESFNDTFKAELKLGQIFVAFTQLSILIACLGLFGLATYDVKTRTKEIGIKKVLGANVRQITTQLSIHFLKLVLVSLFIAIPLGWYVTNIWLQDFAFRIDLGLWIFVLAAVLALLISFLTVSFQSIKAALANPVKSLRSE